MHRGGGHKRNCQISHFVRNFGRNLNSSNQSREKAFTLAEVLITLVIIGVVAALTIPSVIVSYQKHQTVTKLKKVYSVLSQTTNKAIADNGPIKNWEINKENGGGETKAFVDKYIAPYLNVIKNCRYETTGACEFKKSALNNQSNQKVYDNTYYKLILADGTSIYFLNDKDNYTKDGIPQPRSYVGVQVDINGQKGPNVYGKDLFYFVYWIQNPSPNFEGKFVPNGLRNTREESLSNACNKEKNGTLCAGLIMLDGWQIKDDYPW